VAYAKDLLARGHSSGLECLADRRRLDLSTEALMLTARYTPLFTETERATARRLLISSLMRHGYSRDAAEAEVLRITGGSW
jgi:hypothetical protein